ncbi:unnamed protein product [Caenorhabditis bovis]|uniref:NADP-dependent oxidoreductase domain-containing protein n=1 Tax=Caenorhabditis bovis TaxID=2654633 RepID=A0A8S1ENT0_9PELO|nr:unnamed protein product [Caenorhabditis bovis]
MVIGGPTLKLSNGVVMPQVGLGTWLSTPEEVKAAVKAAVKNGYRLIDTAKLYENEQAIGDAIQELIKEGVVKREDLFITTKAFVTELAPGKLEPALRASLKRLQMDYVDLYLAHMPATMNDDMSDKINVPIEEVWKGFEQVYNLKLARAVGVSNTNNDQIARILKSSSVPVHNSQVELHLYFPQHEHVDFCKKNNIIVTSYATLGSPGRKEAVFPDGKKIDWGDAPLELEDANVKKLGEKYNKSPAQVLLRYAMDRGLAIIPKSINEKRIIENFQLFDFKLSQDEIKLLESTKYNKRLFLHPFMIGHIEDAFKSER